uniref:hypothetical protein n=1 Tax=Paractinoplanes polyasparticus TaxID=2856853 RepID=UPI001C847237|nr:hypothetical protein [Actinoplanes polyasparticus]
MTWIPTDWAAQDRRNIVSLLKVAAAGRSIYLVRENGDSFYRYDELPSDWDDSIPDGSMVVDEVVWLLRDGLLESKGDEAVITGAGRRYLSEATA